MMDINVDTNSYWQANVTETSRYIESTDPYLIEILRFLKVNQEPPIKTEELGLLYNYS